MSEGVSICSLCGRTMNTSGNHQICCLSCGHLFGYSCITRHFSISTECPICRKKIQLNDIQLLFWDDSLGLKQCVNKKIEAENLKLQNEIDSLNSKIQGLHNNVEKATEKISSYLKHDSNFQSFSRKPLDVISRPGLICQKIIKSGLRLNSFLNHVVVTSSEVNKTDSSITYGILHASYSNLSDFSFLPLHQSQIRDTSISRDERLFATCSFDQSVSIVAVDTMKLTDKIQTQFSLWSCSWHNDHLIFTGSDKGNFLSIDSRSGKISMNYEFKGPPINSICSISDNVVLLMTGRSIIFYDLRSNRNLDLNKGCIFTHPIRGGLSLKKIKNSTKYVYTTKTDDKYFCGISNIDLVHGFSPQLSLEIPKIFPISRPSAINLQNDIYFSYPLEQTCSFSLQTLHNPKNDLWSIWQQNWMDGMHPSPILDLCFDQAPDPIICSVSADTLKIFQIPIC